MALTFIPNPGQNLQQTRDPIRQNFIDIDTAFTVDHGTYALPGAGLHNKITMPDGADVTAGYTATQTGFFNHVNASTGRNEIYAVQANNLSYPMTAWGFAGTIGWTYIPSGYVVKFGRATIPAGTDTTVNFGNPPYTVCRSVTCNAVPTAGTVPGTYYFVEIHNTTVNSMVVRPIQVDGTGMHPTTVGIDVTYIAIGEL
jgi:hypothetical protein